MWRSGRKARDGGFDRVAALYPWLERVAFGRALQRTRVAFVDDVVVARDVLLVGEGDGRAAACIAQAQPDARITLVDASAVQLRRAKARLERCGVARRCRFLQRDLLRLEDYRESGRDFDLLVTPFVLDCFEGDALVDLVHSLSGQLSGQHSGPDGQLGGARGSGDEGPEVEAEASAAYWIHADFLPPAAASGLSALRSRLWTGGLYRFFARAAGLEARRLECPSPAMRAAGFECVAEQRFRAGLLHAQLWRRGARRATMR